MEASKVISRLIKEICIEKGIDFNTLTDIQRIIVQQSALIRYLDLMKRNQDSINYVDMTNFVNLIEE